MFTTARLYGERIAFMRREDGNWRLWSMRADGTDERRIGSDEGEWNDFNPVWAPDGRRIVFETSRHDGDQDEIYVLDLKRGTERRLTATPGNDVYPDWSPDGSRIAYCTIADGSAHISVIPADGGEPRRLIENACFPRWSPDGTSLAYVGFGPDRSERLWVQRLGTDERFEVRSPGDDR